MPRAGHRPAGVLTEAGVLRPRPPAGVGVFRPASSGRHPPSLCPLEGSLCGQHDRPRPDAWRPASSCTSKSSLFGSGSVPPVPSATSGWGLQTVLCSHMTHRQPPPSQAPTQTAPPPTWVGRPKGQLSGVALAAPRLTLQTGLPVKIAVIDYSYRPRPRPGTTLARPCRTTKALARGVLPGYHLCHFGIWLQLELDRTRQSS